MESWERRILRPVVIAVGVLLVVAPLYAGDLTSGGQTVLVVGGLAVLLEVGLSAYRDRGRAGRKTVSIHTEHGENVIAIDALEGILRDEVRKADDVHDVAVRLEVGEEGQPIHCRLRFKLDNQPDIPGRTDVHRTTVREAFQRLIPGDVPLEIDCRVDDILVEGARPAEPKASGGGQSGDSFSGPVYPVLGEGEEREAESY